MDAPRERLDCQPKLGLGYATNMTTFNVLLAVHVLGVVWWVGGVAMVTAVLLPIFNRLLAQERIKRIKQLEDRFANQARVAVVLVGITGFWMLGLTGGFARLQFAHGWWIDLMLLVWVLFVVMLFVAEPLRLPAKLGLIHKPHAFLILHAVLLTLALAAIFCGVVGASGGF
jgi:uncharacterized membrane protein